MGRRKRRGNRLPPFVALIYKLLDSQAYSDLPPSAAKALPHFFRKVKRTPDDPQRYIQEFDFSYKEGGRFGFHPATFFGVIEALVGMGFLDPVKKGGLKSDRKSYNIFRLSRRWESYGTSNFKSIEWKCFMPGK